MTIIVRLLNQLKNIWKNNGNEKLEQKDISCIMLFISISIFTIFGLLLFNKTIFYFMSYVYIMILLVLCALKLLTLRRGGVLVSVAVLFFIIHLTLWLIFDNLFKSENFLRIDDLFEALMYIMLLIALGNTDYKIKPKYSIYFLLTILVLSVTFINPKFLNSNKWPLDTVIDVILINLVLFRAAPHMESFIRGLAPDGRFFWILGLIMAWMAEPVDGMLESGIKLFDSKFIEFLFVSSVFYIAVGFIAEFQHWKTELWSFTIGVGSLLIAWIAGVIVSYKATPLLHHTWSAIGGYVIFVLSIAIIMSNKVRINRTNKQISGWSMLIDEITGKFSKDTTVEEIINNVFKILKKNIQNVIGISFNIPDNLLIGDVSKYSLPLYDRKIPIGFIYLKEQTVYIEDLEAFTPILGRRLREEITKAEWRDKAITDPLTSLYNRNGYNLLIFDIINNCKENNAILSVAMVDIDHFKKINDSYGHNIGDKVLISLAKTIKGTLRKDDYVVRWGGEEFLIILVDTTLVEAKRVIDRIREKLILIRIEPIDWNISFSSGISGGAIPDNIENIEVWIEKADSALYRAKEKGRNRVEIAKPD
jgi:diguanylate cyclase (GGDEF)-like protein